jgi:iron complex outermembrane receptor protein
MQTKVNSRERTVHTVVIFILSFLFIETVQAQNSSSDDFSLDEFSEGLDIKESNIQKTEQEDLQKSVVKAAPEDKEYEKLAVTGSHIKRIDMEGASPVMMIDRDMIEQSGHNSVSDVLRDMTASSFGGAREASGSNAAGVASVSLRGLGADKTLVLLNGKRLPADAVTGSVDLNLIPLAAVKRIDILKDGASATYGSDALGGVVNIITHRDFNGSKISYQESFMTQFKGGKTKQVEFITGSATARSSITTVMSFRENEKFFSRDRPWSDEGISTTGSPGSYIDNSGVWKPDTNNCNPADIIDGGSGNEFCSFNYANFSTELPELRQFNIMTLFEYEMDNGITIYGRANATKKDVKWNFAPAPGVFSIGAAQAAGLGIPGYAGGDVTLRYRAVELGNREKEIDTHSFGFQTGLRGSLTNTWDWDLTFDRNTIYKNDLGVSGYGITDTIEELITSGDFNPFDYSSSRGNLDSAKYQPWQLSRSENNFTELKVSGELFNTKHGAVGAAVGATHTQEMFSTEVDDLSANGRVFGSAGSSGGGRRETKSFFVETITPLAKTMELQLAARYDHFDDFGSTTNPKLGFKWNITKSIMFRASAGTGFKAPQLKDLYAADSDGFPTFIDEVACKQEQDAGGATPNCTPQQWNVKSGGNDSLQEEKSESYNIGIMYQPTKRNSVGFDIWQTKLNNVVGINYQQLTQFELDGGDLSKFGIEVDRDASGKIDSINAPLLNLASLQISGIDLNAAYAISNNFTLQLQHSHLFYYKNEGFPGTGFDDILGENGFPAWRNNITLDFSKGKTNVRLIAKTVGEHEKSVPEEGDIPSYTEFDLNYSRVLTSNSSLTVGVQNLLQSEPPLDDSKQNQQLNAELYNPRGQNIFVGFKHRF